MPGLPSRIGKYTVHERLGRGGMAEVYLAHDDQLDRLVAIKLLREIDHADLRERFQREARAIARLTHPNIVTIFELGDHEDRPFIAMEYVAGESLAEMIRRRARLSMGERLKLIEDLSLGLACAHRAGIVHRDVKPANLMVDCQGVLKVLDFGIVRMAGPGLTQMGMLVGTASYMSPEQVAAGPVDHRSDIFSVGAVFYELLSYRQAFSGPFAEAIAKIAHAEPDPIASVCPGLDPKVAAMVDRCLRKAPDERYQSLLALGADLARVGQRIDNAGKWYEADLEAATLIVPAPALSDAAAGASDVHAGPPDVDAWLREASAHIKGGRFTAASQLIGRATEHAPDAAGVRALRGELEHHVVEQERLEQRKRSVHAALKRAEAKLEEGAHESALRAIAEALALEPDSAAALALRVQVESAMAAERRRRDARQAAEAVVRDARQRVADGDPTGALRLLEQHAPRHDLIAAARDALRDELARRAADEREAAARAEARRIAEAREREVGDLVARARALAAEGAILAALDLLDREARDHPLAREVHHELWWARRRQEWQELWREVRGGALASSRVVDRFVSERVMPAGAHVGGRLRDARLQTAARGRRLMRDRRRAAVFGLLIGLIMAGGVFMGWPVGSTTAVQTAAGTPEAAVEPGEHSAGDDATPGGGAPMPDRGPGPTDVSTGAAIVRLLNDYELAYGSLDESRVRQLQPSFGGFPPTYRQLLRSVTLSILHTSIQIAPDGETATVRGLLRYDYEWRRAGLPGDATNNVTWRLQKTGDTWLIVD